MKEPVIIDSINLRLPRGWRGDPTRLARQVAEQLQQQAAQLHGGKQLDLQLRGPFAGAERRIASALETRLQAANPGSGVRSKRK